MPCRKSITTPSSITLQVLLLQLTVTVVVLAAVAAVVVVLAAAVSATAARVHDGAPRDDARATRLLGALGLLKSVELRDLLFLEALEVAALPLVLNICS